MDIQSRIDASLALDFALDQELLDLRGEDRTLGHREMQRRVAIKERCEAIGKQRFEMFMDRRKLYDQLENQQSLNLKY